MIERHYTTAQLCELLNLHEETVRKYARTAPHRAWRALLVEVTEPLAQQQIELNRLRRVACGHRPGRSTRKPLRSC